MSQVKTRTNDARLIRYLSDLTASAHSIIYVPPRKSTFHIGIKFIFEGFARQIARSWKFHATSAALLLGGAIVAFFASAHDPIAAYALMMPGDTRLPGSSKEQLLEILRSGRDTGSGNKFFFASFLFSHNLKVSILAMGVGLLAAVPTTILMVYNGMILGSFVSIHHQAGITTELWAWILPHGITEIGAIILCGGVGLMFGKAVVSPGLVSRSESLRQAGVAAGKTCLGTAAMLIFAAVVESYLRQSQLSTSARLYFAAGTAIFWTLFITHGFLCERRARQSEIENSLIAENLDELAPVV